MNTVILVGNISQDIQVKKTATGKSYVQFNVAVNDGVDDKGQKKAQFIRCVAWEKTADSLGAYCRKGSKVGVQGRLVNSSYEDPKLKDVRRFTTDVVVSSVEFLSSKKDETSEENIPQ